MRRLSLLVGVTALIVALGAGHGAGTAVAYDEDGVEKYCRKAVEIQALLDASNVDANDANSIKTYARQVAKGLKKLAKLAPTTALRKDLKTLAKAYVTVADTGDLSQNFPRKAIDAQLRIQDYVGANCAVPTS